MTMHLEDMDLSDEPAAPTPQPPPEVIGQGADQEAAAHTAYRAPSTPAPQRLAPVTPAATAHPLADRFAEEHVIACCLLDQGPTLDRARAILTPASFNTPECAILFRQLSSLADEGLPLTDAALVEYRAEQLRGINPMLLVQLTDPDKYPTTAHAGLMIERVRELASRRTIQREIRKALEQIDNGADTADLRPEIRSMAPALSLDTSTDAISTRRVRHATKPAEPVTRLFLNGKPVCTPANLTTIISRAKTGKTTALGAAVAAILGAHYDRHDLDTFKFSAPHTDEAVILIDTEQSPYDAWTCHHRTLQRAGDPVDPEWLHHYALVGLGAKQLRDSLTSILARATTAHKGIFTIILDGVADFVTSVNDEAETNEFVAWLQGLAVAHNTPIICVIHSNEGVKNGDDGRGHLGKQLTRKAESNLLLKKVGEITTITSEKQRKAPITEQDGVAFRWDDEYQRHVSCEPEEEEARPKGGKPKQYFFDKFTSIFPRSADKAMTKLALLRFAQDISDIKETAFRDILNEAVGRGELIRTSRAGAFHYHLNVPGPV